MRFIYCENAGENSLKIDGERYVHVFKARRASCEEAIFLRNLKDEYLYEYKILQINKKEALCELVKAAKTPSKATKDFQIAWCVIDPKIIEKTLPFLNEVGVKKLIFVYARFSQKNFKIDFDRLRRIVINSCEQCGRSDLMEFEIFNSLGEFLNNYEDIAVVDFSQTKFSQIRQKPKTWLIGCEGGFSAEEKKELQKFATAGLESENILRSESAVMAIAAKLFL
jgi:16S rRNA (uracil1498-N3)-methyltransferase